MSYQAAALDMDSHRPCITCRSRECNVDLRYEVCIDWSFNKMSDFIKYQKHPEIHSVVDEVAQSWEARFTSLKQN